jgi:hypothetical protein
VLQGTAHSGDNSTTQQDNNLEFPLQEPKATTELQNDVGINPSSRVKNTVPPQVVQDVEASCNSHSLFKIELLFGFVCDWKQLFNTRALGGDDSSSVPVPQSMAGSRYLHHLYFIPLINNSFYLFIF